ncbi:hypothetical protein AAJV73_08495 [Cyanobium sp. BSA11S]|uniref:hypothetical protein n=1 Tax=Cyanobium sp. BSA11S TaxID=3108224 RepID=UPI003D813A65
MDQLSAGAAIEDPAKQRCQNWVWAWFDWLRWFSNRVAGLATLYKDGHRMWRSGSNEYPDNIPQIYKNEGG